MIDAEVISYALLTRDCPGEVTVSASYDAEGMDEFPLLTFNLTGDGQVSNGPRLWTFVLTVNVFAEGMDAAKTLAKQVYNIISSWGSTVEAVVPGEGWVTEVTDIDIFSRLPSAVIDGRNVTQYTGSFGLALRN